MCHRRAQAVCSRWSCPLVAPKRLARRGLCGHRFGRAFEQPGRRRSFVSSRRSARSRLARLKRTLEVFHWQQVTRARASISRVASGPDIWAMCRFLQSYRRYDGGPHWVQPAHAAKRLGPARLQRRHHLELGGLTCSRIGLPPRQDHGAGRCHGFSSRGGNARGRSLRGSFDGWSAAWPASRRG